MDPSLVSFDSTGGTVNINWNRTQWASSNRCDTSIETESSKALAGYNFRYGYVEVRMKWDNVVGAWPGIWLLPTQAIQGAQQTGEIDLFEGQGLDSHYYGTLHTWDGQTQTWNTNTNNRFKTPAGTDYSQWHTYGLLWTPPAGGNPGTITWYFDDVAVGSNNTTASANSIFDQETFFLILTNQEGIWSLDTNGVCHPDTDGSTDSFNVSVDWVHIWGS
jgi:beta-glucanase (GH16 family)